MEPGYLAPPLYLSGAMRPELVGVPGFGYMRTPRMGNRPLPGPWAADTGCYTTRGVSDFTLPAYLDWLAAQDVASCLFATAPDRVRDARETWRLSAPVLPSLRALGYRAALVAQDGIEHDPIPWDAFDVLFIGGSTAWKFSPHVAQLVREAKDRGVWAHLGRVNSARRYAHAARLGYHSVDGTYLAFGPARNLPRLHRWPRALDQGVLL